VGYRREVGAIGLEREASDRHMADGDLATEIPRA
jgi:hypothetical protein